MIRLITAGAFALLLAGCTADAKPDVEGGNTPTANEVKVVTDTTAKYELGKNI
ncbi:MAG: hypothetical protein ACI9SE_001978 [Neolewinella sp.]|jgi:hypothetical protein